MDRLTGQDGMSKASWEKVIALLSYSPTAFGIFFLMTSRETGDSYEDKSGVSGVMAGLMCVAYGLCAGAASSGCPADICKVLVLARLGLGVVALLAGIFILALGDETEKAIKFVLMYLFLALMTVPEAGSFYLYVRQVQLEKFMAENADPQGSYPMSNQQMPMQLEQSYVWDLISLPELCQRKLQVFISCVGNIKISRCNNGLQVYLLGTYHRQSLNKWQVRKVHEFGPSAIWVLARRFDGAFKWCLAVKAWQLCKQPSSKQRLWQHMLASKLIGQGSEDFERFAVPSHSYLSVGPFKPSAPSRTGQVAGAAAVFAFGAWVSRQRHSVRCQRKANVVELAPGAWPAESITHPSEAELSASGADVWPAPENDRLLRHRARHFEVADT
eukprot:s1617_g5.t1